MSNSIYFSLTPQELPIISAFDIASIKPPYVHFDRQYHEFILYYIISGELFISEDHIHYHLSTNDFILLGPTRKHSGFKTSTCEFFYIHFTLPHLLETSLTETELTNLFPKQQLIDLELDTLPPIYLPKSHSITNSSNIVEIYSLLNKALEAFSSHQLYYSFKVSCLLYELLISFSKDFSYSLLYDFKKTQSTHHKTVPDLLNFLNQSYSIHISSTLIESKYNCNFDYLNRQFKIMTGQTIFAYLNNLRIEKAKQLLSTGFYTINDIANRTGFRDAYYFSKVFKKITGTTPRTYKTQISNMIINA